MYASLTVVQLRELAKSNGLTGYSKLRKEDLVALLTQTKKGSKEHKEHKEHQKPKEYKEAKEHKEAKETKEDKEAEYEEEPVVKKDRHQVPKEFEAEFLKLRCDGADTFIKVAQLGKPGKEGTVFLVTDTSLSKYAMKTYRKTKSGRMIEREAYLQYLAAKEGISPKVIQYNPEEKYIVMDVLSRTLMDILKQQNGTLTLHQQKQIIELYQKLDTIGIMLNDANPLNIMEKDGKMYAIDYGFAKFSFHKNFKEYKHPNYQLMPLGLLLWLKGKYPIANFEYIKSQIDPEVAKKMGIAQWP